MRRMRHGNEACNAGYGSHLEGRSPGRIGALNRLRRTCGMAGNNLYVVNAVGTATIFASWVVIRK